MTAKLFQFPIARELDTANSILIAGCGGGYDVFSGLPLYFALRNAGKKVFLANYSFSKIKTGKRLEENLVEVSHNTAPAFGYFPERYLSEWFNRRGETVPIYCFDRNPGCTKLLNAYESLASELDLDTIVLADGGTDSLMRGDELELGTPVEDMTSIAAINKLDSVKTKILVSLGFGVEHQVSHSQVLESVAELMRINAFLGAISLTQDMPEVAQFRDASEYVFSKMPHYKSIVVTSILAAMDGQYGNTHSTWRTAGSKLWINPLMTILWCFKLEELAKRVIYIQEMENKATQDEVAFAIMKYRFGKKKRKGEAIPI